MFIEQFNQTKNKPKLLSNRQTLKSWLEEVADLLTNNPANFESIYSTVQKSVDESVKKNKSINKAYTQTHTCVVAQFGIDKESRTKTNTASLLPIPALNMEEVLKELESGKIEITIDKENNSFHGTRLFLEKDMRSDWAQEFNNTNNPGGFMAMSMLALPWLLLGSDKVSCYGYKIMVDFSPKPKLSCSIS